METNITSQNEEHSDKYTDSRTFSVLVLELLYESVTEKCPPRF